MTVFIGKLKITLPNIVMRGGSGMPAISKMELLVVVALLCNPLTFIAESPILHSPSMQSRS